MKVKVAASTTQAHSRMNCVSRICPSHEYQLHSEVFNENASEVVLSKDVLQEAGPFKTRMSSYAGSRDSILKVVIIVHTYASR